jgi:endonuclease YncB( thermonuclease family)
VGKEWVFRYCGKRESGEMKMSFGEWLVQHGYATSADPHEIQAQLSADEVDYLYYVYKEENCFGNPDSDNEW